MSIISRIWSAIRTRDWGVAVIDIGVVAVGILMALAVDNWHTERQSKDTELQILQRAHAAAYSASRAFNKRMVGLLSDLDDQYDTRRQVFFNPADDALSDYQCLMLAQKHMLYVPDWKIPAIQELIQSGRLSDVKDTEILNAALDYIDYRDLYVLASGLQSEKMINLYVEFPEFIQSTLVEVDDPDDRDGFKPVAICDRQRMHESFSFRNSLDSNLQHELRNIEGINAEVLPKLNKVHDLLDARLGIAHK